MKTVSNNIVTRTLLSQYFKMVSEERIGETPEQTKEIDALETEIKDRLKREATV